jgi:hypothetical protein
MERVPERDGDVTMDENLIGYLLNALEPDERRRVEDYLRDHPDARQKLELLRSALAPLESDREQPATPAGLVERTMTRIREVIGKPRIRVPLLDGGGPDFSKSRWRAVDVLVGCCILMLVGGLGTSGVMQVRQFRDRTECQNNLRNGYGSLTSYAQVHNGQLPTISNRPPYNHVGSFVVILSQSGQLPPQVKLACPSGTAPTFAYYLPYRDGAGGLHGLIAGTEHADPDTMPVMADVPQVQTHGRGFNVLLLGGAVRFSTSPNIGIDGDHIFVNDFLRVAAGNRHDDSVLAAGEVEP